METELLLKLQDAETQILVMLDEFCKARGIKYSLAYGTALGAVRHGGFIPWDDDVDVFMVRHEYDRFLSAWREDPPAGYSLLASDEENNIFAHTKIYKDNTIMATTEEDLKKPGYHGFFLDIFPLDKIPTDKKKRKKFIFKAKLRLVYMRNHPFKAGRGVRGKMLELASRIMLTIPKKKKRKIVNDGYAHIMQYKDMTTDYEYINASATDTFNDFFSADLVSDYIDIKFGDHEFPIFKQYDDLLRIMYGDYMQLPPESERVCKHNPQILCFDTTAENSVDSASESESNNE